MLDFPNAPSHGQNFGAYTFSATDNSWQDATPVPGNVRVRLIEQGVVDNQPSFTLLNNFSSQNYGYRLLISNLRPAGNMWLMARISSDSGATYPSVTLQYQTNYLYSYMSGAGGGPLRGNAGTDANLTRGIYIGSPLGADTHGWSFMIDIPYNWSGEFPQIMAQSAYPGLTSSVVLESGGYYLVATTFFHKLGIFGQQQSGTGAVNFSCKWQLWGY